MLTINRGLTVYWYNQYVLCLITQLKSKFTVKEKEQLRLKSKFTGSCILKTRMFLSFLWPKLTKCCFIPRWGREGGRGKDSIPSIEILQDPLFWGLLWLLNRLAIHSFLLIKVDRFVLSLIEVFHTFNLRYYKTLYFVGINLAALTD